MCLIIFILNIIYLIIIQVLMFLITEKINISISYNRNFLSQTINLVLELLDLKKNYLLIKKVLFNKYRVINKFW